MLQELGKQNPQLLRSIQEHDQEFLQLINEPVDGSDGLVAYCVLFAELELEASFLYIFMILLVFLLSRLKHILFSIILWSSIKGFYHLAVLNHVCI